MIKNMITKYLESGWIYKYRTIIVGVLIILLTHLIAMLITDSGIFGDKVYIGGDNQGQLLGYAAEVRIALHLV